jgi:hypothetical protein
MKLLKSKQQSASAWLQMVQQQVESLQFGVVQIVVHESRVVQIERTEKLRLPNVQPETNEILPNQTTGGISEND